MLDLKYQKAILEKYSDVVAGRFNSLMLLVGVIDFDHRGRVGVIFFNFSRNFYQVSEGNKIAQIIFQKISTPILEEVYNFEDKTVRGEIGFGSTDFQKTCREDL